MIPQNMCISIKNLFKNIPFHVDTEPFLHRRKQLKNNYDFIYSLLIQGIMNTIKFNTCSTKSRTTYILA
jgi:hypothetical protein